MAGDLFRPIFVPERFSEAVSGRAWIGAMLEAAGAFAVAQARAGLIPRQAAETIVSCCDADHIVPEEIGRKGRAKGNPVPPLVRAFARAVSRVSEDAAGYVHKGATSQDIMDTAAMLVCRNALDMALPEIDGISAASRRVLESGKPLREQLLSEPRLGEVLSERQIDAVLDPARYLGFAGEFVDRALKLYREREIK
jgi:3-carboxy-cis,cis-muconate cycloisomerase